MDSNVSWTNQVNLNSCPGGTVVLESGGALWVVTTQAPDPQGRITVCDPINGVLDKKAGDLKVVKATTATLTVVV